MIDDSLATGYGNRNFMNIHRDLQHLYKERL